MSPLPERHLSPCAPTTDNSAARPIWLALLRRYALALLIANLLWETAQLPLYTIWADGNFSQMAFAVLHCTAGDLLIAGAALLLALLFAGCNDWPRRRFNGVAWIAAILGVAYTIFSEWLNISVRQSWAYSPLMPTIPGIGTGLAPLAQWLAIPGVCLWWARKRADMPDEQAPIEPR